MNIFLDNKNEWYSILSLLNLTQNNQVQLYVYVNTKKVDKHSFITTTGTLPITPCLN